MKSVQAWKRRRAIKFLTSHLLDMEKKCFTVLIDYFPDEHLMKLAESHKLLKRGESLDRIAHEHYEEFFGLNKSLWKAYINASDLSECGDSNFIDEVALYVDLARSIMEEYDPDGTKYPHAIHQMPQDIIAYAGRTFSDKNTPLENPEVDSITKKRTFLAVTLLTFADTHAIHYGFTFYPSFCPSDRLPKTFSEAITSEIMRNTNGDPREYAQRFAARRNRSMELKEKFIHDFSNADPIYDYPDDLIRRMVMAKPVKMSNLNELAKLVKSDEAALRDVLDVFDTLEDPYHDLTDIYLLLQRVDNYPQMQKAAQSSTAGDHFQQRAALLNIMLTLQKAKNIFPICDAHELIKDERMIDLIAEDPNNGAVIASTVAERRGYNHDEVLAVLNAGALGSGAL